MHPFLGSLKTGENDLGRPEVVLRALWLVQRQGLVIAPCRKVLGAWKLNQVMTGICTRLDTGIVDR